MHVHVGGAQTVVNFIGVVVLLGVFNLLALRFKNSNPLAAAWANLFLGVDH